MAVVFKFNLFLQSVATGKLIIFDYKQKVYPTFQFKNGDTMKMDQIILVKW